MRNDLRSASACKRLLIILVAAFAAIRPVLAEDLVIAKDGKTDYQLVIPASNPKPVCHAFPTALRMAWIPTPGVAEHLVKGCQLLVFSGDRRQRP